jgi:large subunit ribosomal protein L25
MTESFNFTAQLRDRVGKGASREARRNKLVPATIYGDSKDPISVCLDPKEVLSQLVKASVYSNIYTVTVSNKKEDVLIRNIQLHPVSDLPLHVDLLRIGAKTRTRLEIPIVFHNQAKCPGLKFGGSLNIVTHYLEVACNPKDAPKTIDIDLETAKVGTVIKIEDIVLPEGAKTYYPKGFALASITSSGDEDKEKGKTESGE